jgi:hypothetical protein
VLEQVAAALGTEVGGPLPDEAARVALTPTGHASAATGPPAPDTVRDAPDGMPSGPIEPE